MKHTYENGAIVAKGQAFEQALYHVSNEALSAAFDGKGILAYYALAGQEPINARFGFSVFIDGEAANICAEKQITMQGRRQSITWHIDACFSLMIDQFLDTSRHGVLVSYRILGDIGAHTVDVVVMHSRFRKGKVGQTGQGRLLIGDDVSFAASCAFDYIPENNAVCLRLDASISAMNTYFTLGEQVDAEEALAVVDDLDTICRRCLDEIQSIRVPEGLSETEKAMFYSTYFCSLENFKTQGDYRAFMAGYRYLLPMRSYYRDSYYTVLPMYNGQADKVRDQLRTLARGISADGSCPSAVKSDFTEWWGNHFDSPSYLAMMLYDYVKFTGDTSVMDETVAHGDTAVTLLTCATRAVEHLGENADETGLLYKPGNYNKCDWADEVNRNGYVTYNEALYYRAMISLSRLYAMRGETEQAELWSARAARVKDAINAILWNEELGYYINFKQGEHEERNLSIDTVFTVLFGIADGERARSVLSCMESMLESGNNPAMRELGDFGAACVYPLYSGSRTAYYKSARPYDYHNGANWPYLTAVYALAKRKFGMAWREVLTGWFTDNVEQGNYTPIEYYSPVCPDGSLLQAWGGAVAFVLDVAVSEHFWD